MICEFALRTEPVQDRVLDIRLDIGRRIYNACVGESLTRLGLVRQSKDFQKACKLPRKSKERTSLFKQVNERCAFTESALHSYTAQFTHSWLSEHVDSSTAQKIASRAFSATQQYAFRTRGKPRFKGRNQFGSIEGKSNATGIRWRDNQVHWMGLVLVPIIDETNEIHRHALEAEVKYVRLVRRTLNGRKRYYVQLVCKAMPFRKDKHKLGQGKVGLDLGPSTVAVVAPEAEVALLTPFCHALERRDEELRRLQRKADRQRRAANPGNYNTDGTIRLGRHDWVVSNGLRSTLNRVAELQRVQAAHRKSLHGQLANRIVSLGDTFCLEKLSYRAFQKLWGRSVGFRAPGRFVEHLVRSAERAGGRVEMFLPYRPALSQRCVCGRKKKKPLSQRVHQCPCGVKAQRDLFSSFLACHVQDGDLCVASAASAWPGVERLLGSDTEKAGKVAKQATKEGQPPRSVVPEPRRSRSVPNWSDTASESGCCTPAGGEPDSGQSINRIPWL